MAKGLVFRYDKVGDILYIDKVKPYASQESEELGDDIGVRRNPATFEVETIEILCFKQRLDAGQDIVLPLDAALQTLDAE
jgi:uncharacterized protein YuzE